MLFACAHIHWFGKKMARRQARKSLLGLYRSRRFLRISSVPESAACRLYVRKQTTCCHMACLSTKLPILPKSRKRVCLVKNHLFDNPSWKSTAEWHLLSLFAWQVLWLALIICSMWWFVGFCWCSGVFRDIINKGARAACGVWGYYSFQCHVSQEHCSGGTSMPVSQTSGGSCLGACGSLFQLSYGNWWAWSWFGYELQLHLWQECQYTTGCRGNSLSLPSVFCPQSKVPIAVRARFVLTTRHIRSLSLLLPPFSKFVRRQEGIALSRVIIKQFVIYASLCPCVYRAQIWWSTAKPI